MMFYLFVSVANPAAILSLKLCAIVVLFCLVTQRGQRMEVITFRDSWGVFFNVSQHVGHGRTNNAEDVMLVQFMIRKVAQKAMKISPDLRAKMLNVSLNGKCDDATVEAIKGVQEHIRVKQPGTVVDGWISPARNSYLYGAGQYTIISLNDAVRRFYPERWPRLQDIAECPGALKAKVPKLL